MHVVLLRAARTVPVPLVLHCSMPVFDPKECRVAHPWIVYSKCTASALMQKACRLVGRLLELICKGLGLDFEAAASATAAYMKICGVCLSWELRNSRASAGGRKAP